MPRWERCVNGALVVPFVLAVVATWFFAEAFQHGFPHILATLQ